ncbi:MAG: 2-phosphosulfolactate phosphatase [Peptococcaceae bacterium]
MIYHLNVYPTWQSVAPSEIKNTISVVIDVLRASNTIITALNNGAEKIIPLTEIDPAWELKAKNPEFLLGGERKSEKIAGFDFGNSPREYDKAKVAGKTIIFTTSNGSKALQKAAPAAEVLVASFANSTALARRLAGRQRDVSVICAGTLATPSLEDTLAAGKIISHIENLHEYVLNDYAYLALGSYQNYRSKLLEVVLNSANGRRLRNLGQMEDIKHCVLENITAKIPEYQENIVV